MSPSLVGPTGDYTNDVYDYLELSGEVVPGEVDVAYVVERAAQADRCRVPDDGTLPVALIEALCRRVARNLAMRGLPLGIQMDDSGGTRIGSVDPEVRRLEAPYRRLKVG